VTAALGGCLALALGLTLVVLGPTDQPSESAASAVRPARAASAQETTPTLTVRLDTRTARAGAPIHGTVTVNNNSGSPMSVDSGSCVAWLRVGLTASNGSGPSSLLPTTLPKCGPVDIPVGKSTYDVTVRTSYIGCSPGPPQGHDFPSCDQAGPDGVPLPPGHYHTVVAAPDQLTVANTIDVELTG
jgi:hypothetical protein